MYHPADAAGSNTPIDEEFEFIELQNISGQPLNLDGREVHAGRRLHARRT